METGPRIGDAFGSMLRECSRAPDGAARVAEIIERDDGFIYVQRPTRYFAAPPDWARFERDALELTRGAVLDVGCGAGRFTLALQERDVPVTALDVSAGAVEVSRRRGVLAAVHGSVAELSPAAGYDTFLLMGENLGLLQSAGRAAGFLGSLAALARPGARIIGHGADPHAAAAADPALAAYLRRDQPGQGQPGQRHPVQGQAQGQPGPQERLPGEMTIRLRHRDLATAWFGYLLCSPAELAALAEPAGWELTSADYADQANYLAVLTLRR
jgi:SAM-dependent methyltransferase